jgi:hypothetical protein
MKRLHNGDIGAAWEDIISRLTDLGEAPSPAATPSEIAQTVDDAMTPLAHVYSRAIYGPEGTIATRHVNTAIESLDQTRNRLATRHSMAQRFVAAYRPTTVIPETVRRTAKKLRFNGNGRRNGS